MGRGGPVQRHHWRGCLKVQPQTCGGIGPWADGCRRRRGPPFFLGLEVACWKEEILNRCTTDVAV